MTSTRAILSPLVPTSSKIFGERSPGGKDTAMSTNTHWIRAVCYNEAVFPSPHTYDPERFLNDGKLDTSVWDPEESVFGSGRRYSFYTVTRSVVP